MKAQADAPLQLRGCLRGRLKRQGGEAEETVFVILQNLGNPIVLNLTCFYCQVGILVVEERERRYGQYLSMHARAIHVCDSVLQVPAAAGEKRIAELMDDERGGVLDP